MDVIAFSETLVVLLTVIRYQFAEGMFQYTVVGSRIDLYCETGEEFGVDWVFKNQTGRHNIYRDNTIPQKFVDRYSVSVSSNETTVLSAENVESTYGGTYECLQGNNQLPLTTIFLLVITPKLCNANGNASAVGNTSHELYCSFSIAQSNSSADRWPTELCVNGAQWYCQILNIANGKLDSDCISSASGKFSSEYANARNIASLRINASHKCASNSVKNTSTSTSSALVTSTPSALVISSDGDKGDNQIIIVICIAIGGITLLAILLVTVLTRARNNWKRKNREIRTGITHQIENDRPIEGHQPTDIYHAIDDFSEFKIDRSTEGQHYTPINRGPINGTSEFEIGRSTEEHSYTSINRRLEGAPEIENDRPIEGHHPETLYHSIDDRSEFKIDRPTEEHSYTSINRGLEGAPESEIGRSIEEHSYTSINRRLEGAPAYEDVLL